MREGPAGCFKFGRAFLLNIADAEKQGLNTSPNHREMKKQLLLLAFVALGLSAHGQNPGTLDLSFDPGTGAEGSWGIVWTTAIQPDGKVIIGGNFTYFDGTAMNCIARLNADGTLDGSFPNVGTGESSGVFTTAIQPDGKIIIGGAFISYDGTASNNIARLNADGTLDDSFTVGTGANDYVLTTSVQPDGKIIIGGDFTSYNGMARNGITRLNADGTLDGSFTVGTGANNTVRTTTVQPDGKIIIGGEFTHYDGTARSGIARLNSDGSLDGSFTVGTGADLIYASAIQPDGKILIGGEFWSYNGTPRDYIARLNADGTLDGSFPTGGWGASSAVRAIAVQPDGRIIIGGSFSYYNGTLRDKIARLNADGSVDGSFIVGTGANSSVNTIAIQPDGRIIFGGSFTYYDGTAINRIARLHGDVSVGVDGVPSSGFTIFPNPSSGLYILALGEASGTVQITVTDITGREVYTEQFTATGSTMHTIDLSGQANGVYSLRIRSAQGTSGMKLVKE